MEDRIKAGEFIDWLDEFVMTMKGEGRGSVPCGDCVACCTSSKFIHIRPSDDARRKIPKDIMFPAPGLPKGHFLLGYDENGHCPMFQEGKCSVYECRPETCRQYDCRVLAATGAPINDESHSISAQVKKWVFEFSKPESKDAYKTIRLTMMFLLENGEYFPQGYLPVSSSQLAALAIRVHQEFIGYTAESAMENSEQLISAIKSQY